MVPFETILLVGLSMSNLFAQLNLMYLTLSQLFSLSFSSKTLF